MNTEGDDDAIDLLLGPPPRVLLAHESAETTRMIRDTLENFCVCEIDSTPKPEYAFELAVQRKYKLFFFSLGAAPIGGELLYRLLSTAYLHCHEGERTAPAVIFIGEQADGSRVQELERDVRVKGVLLQPITIDRILRRVAGMLPRRTDR